MRPFSRLPRPVLWLEVVGILLLIAAFLVLQRFFPLPPNFNASSLARGLVFASVALMLPAAATIVWRTLRSWLPGRKN
ncbi:hypothetical protein BTJ39_07460 [Izhakiella australiensis]|uniref:DUF1418 domain-containing protein n=1 Tax=Izhakiella australiensis TaxID=1926881 RepID=A0A1S8YQ37_9GAMM|nr:DUF1418 family protein [Izhakiella australiensis]OON40897.1 hypothetical protein BTJ39_07460 [Izhakiella australiensis]